MKKTYFIYAVVCLTVFGLGIFFAKGNFSFFFNPFGLTIFIVPTFALLLAGFSPAEIIRAFAIALDKNSGSASEYKKSILMFDGIFNYILASALCAVILGFVLMLSHPKEPEKFGFGLAVCLLTILYALIMILVVVLPFKLALKKKLIEIDD